MLVYIVSHAGQFAVGLIGTAATEEEAKELGRKFSAYGVDYTVSVSVLGTPTATRISVH